MKMKLLKKELNESLKNLNAKTKPLENEIGRMKEHQWEAAKSGADTKALMDEYKAIIDEYEALYEKERLVVKRLRALTRDITKVEIINTIIKENDVYDMSLIVDFFRAKKEEFKQFLASRKDTKSTSEKEKNE